MEVTMIETRIRLSPLGRWLLGSLLLLVMFVWYSTPAYAQATEEIDPFVDVNTWLLLLGLVTPFITAVLAKASLSAAGKGAISAVVTALTAFIVALLEEGTDLTFELVFNGWVQIVATHAIAWLMFLNKPVEAVNDSTGGFGIGPAPGH